MPSSAPVLTYRAKELASNIQSKVLKVHNTLININITAISAPEMTYTPKLMQSDKPVLNGISPICSLRTDNGDTLYSIAGVMMTSTPKNGIYIKGDKKYVVDIK